MSRRGLPTCLAIVVALAALLSPIGALAQNQTKPAPQERQDTVLGTGGGATSITRDSNGDTVIRVSPQEQPQEQSATPQITVQPQINLPAGQRKPGKQ